jgi:hypothetical protein
VPYFRRCSTSGAGRKTRLKSTETER